MKSFGKQQQRVFAAFLVGSLLMPCGLQAQTANQQWWLKTDKGQYIEMSRVKGLANVDEEETFKVVVHEGQGASGVKSVTFEKNSLDVVKGDANGDGIVEMNDILEIAKSILGTPSDKFVFDRADVNGDKKVDASDLVAVVNIVNTHKVGARGLSKSFGEALSTSGDDSGTAGWDVEFGTIDPLPGSTLNNRPTQSDYSTKIIQESNTIEQEPEQIVQQEEPEYDLGSVPYFRVQFTKGLLQNKSYAADGFTFFNPAYDYLDFKYSLPLTDGNVSGDPGSSHDYYIGYTPKNHTRFLLANQVGSLLIEKVTAYNLPIKTITVSSSRLSEEVAGKKSITYTFNALPRNLEELKTLEVNDRAYFLSPHFVTALFICCLNRLPDNSSDAWNMIDYLRTHTATVGENNILKVSKVEMQDIVQQLLDNDINGYPVSNGLRSYFAGSSPDNQYTPTKPYQVTIVEKSDVYTTEDGYRCAKLYVESSGSDYLIGPLKLRRVDDHGWLVYSGEKGFTKKMKPQK